MKSKTLYQPLSFQIENFRDDLERLLNERLRLKKQLNHEPAGTLALLLLLYAPVLSVEELCYFFGLGYTVSLNLLDDLRRNGYVTGVTLYPHSKKILSVADTYDSRTAAGVVITKKGFKKVKDFTFFNDYYSFNSDKYYMHAYSNGFNFLSFLTNPFLGRIDSYENEVGATFGRRIAGDGRSLYIDSVVRMGSDTLYLEQDMGNEKKKGELRSKILKYGLHSGYLTRGSGREAVVLSFRKGFVSIAPVKNSKKNMRYNVKAIRRVLECYEDVSDLMAPPYGSIEQLYDKILSGEVSHVYGKDVVAVWEDLKAHDLDYVVNSVLHLRVLAAGLESYTSDIYFNEFNSIQEAFAMKWRNRLIEELLADGVGEKGGSRLSDDIQAFVLDCFHMYAVPTQMMSQYLPFILYQSSFVKSSVEKTLSCYPAFGGLDTKSYEACGLVSNDSVYRIADSQIRYNLTLSNRYEADRMIIFVENLSIDLGASVRLAAAMQCIVRQKPEGGKNIAIIALVTDMEDALYFNELLSLYTIPNKSCFQILFLSIGNTYIKTDRGWGHIEDYCHELSDMFSDGPDKALYRFTGKGAESRIFL